MKNRSFLVFLFLLLFIVEVSGQNYHTQIITFKDSTKAKMIVDDIDDVNILKVDGDYDKKTIFEVLCHNNWSTDSLSYFLRNDKSGNYFTWEKIKWELNNEKYNRTFLAPLNDIWNQCLIDLSPYYNGTNSIIVEDVMNASSSSSIPINSYKPIENKDIFIRHKFLETLASINPTDYKDFISESNDVMNGSIHIIDKYSSNIWKDKNVKDIILTPQYILSNSLITATDHPNIEKYIENGDTIEYVDLIPTGARTKPEINIIVPEILSCNYDIYTVLVPYSPKVQDSDTEPMPNNLSISIHYSDENAKLAKCYFSSDSTSSNSSQKQKPFINDTTKVDTIYVGQIKFPTSYKLYDSSKPIGPTLRFNTPISVFNATLLRTYTRNIRIAAIIFRPKE